MSEALPVITGILAVGIAAQVVAKRMQIPSVLFLILIGVILGPEGLGFVTLETFGGGLATVVGVSVAVILFDGGLHLRRTDLAEAPSTIIRFVTIGAAVMFFGTAIATRFLLGTTWELAFLIGALLIATGPTVITPILDVIQVREHVAATMEAEGVINDVTAAVLAIVIFETIVVEYLPNVALIGFLQRLAVGIGIGVLCAAGAWAVLSWLDTAADDGPQIARLVTLAGAVVAFGLAESVFSETGVAAAATAGVVLGNADLRYREEVLGFSRDLTLVVLAFVFVSLAALIDFDALLGLGLGGVAVVAAVTLLIRPLLVFLSARGRKFTRNEKLFLSLVAPRGIVPAAVATLFAIELERVGQIQAAQTLAGTVFLIIFLTVVIQGGLAREIAERLHVIRMPTIIVGGGRVGRALAERLENRGESVVIVDNDPDVIDELQKAGYSTVEGDGTYDSVLEDAGIEHARIVVVATSNDNTNMLVAQLASSKFDVETVVARVNQPENVDAFETMDVRAIDASTATAWTLDNEIERPALTHWMNELGEGHDVQEIEVTADDLIGQRIREVDAVIPDGCIVAVVSQRDETEGGHVPDPEDVLQRGDRVTFLGNSEAVKQAVERFHPHD